MSSPQRDTTFDELYVAYSQNGQPVPSTQVWRAQWASVLTRYTDEVWGNLLPLVVDARAEVKAAVESEGSEEPVALRRLRAVLGHLRGG